MSMFKAGDKVHRTKGSWYGVEEGDVCVVREVESSPYIGLEGKGDVLFDASCFELVAAAAPIAPATVPHKHAAIIKAWADGAEIQVNFGTGWRSTCYPSWDVSNDFRIKPEVKPDVVRVARINKDGNLYQGNSFSEGSVACGLDHCNVRAIFDGETGNLKDVKII